MPRLISAILLVVVAWSGATVADQFLRSDATFQTALTGANGTLTNAMLADMTQATVKGRASGAGTGAPTDLTQTQLTALCNTVTSSLSGCVSAFPNNTTSFFRGDGTYAAPAIRPVLINTLTLSSTASDTTSLTSTYNVYELVFENVVPSATAAIKLQVHSGGSFQTTTYLANSANWQNTGTSQSNPTDSVPVGGNTGTGIANSGAGLSGFLRVINPADTTHPKWWMGQLAFTSAAASPSFQTVTGFWNGGNGAVDGFQLVLNTGTFSSGTLKIYGLN